MKSNGFTVPDYHYLLFIDGKRADLNATVEASGAKENSVITIYSATGESLDRFFDIEEEEDHEDHRVGNEYSANQYNPNSPSQKDLEDEDLPKEVPQANRSSQVKNSNSSLHQRDSYNSSMRQRESYNSSLRQRESYDAARQRDSYNRSLRQQESYDTRQRDSYDARQRDSSQLSYVESPRSAQSPPTSQISPVTVERRKQKERPSSDASSHRDDKPTQLPENVCVLLATIRSAVSTNEHASQAVDDIETILHNCQTRLYENGVQLQSYQNMVSEINYENQWLRDSYNAVNPSSQGINLEKYKEYFNQTSYPVDSFTNLPDDVIELKKLVNTANATALMNQRRFEKEQKRSRKYKAIAETCSINEENASAFYEYHDTLERYDQLKEENMNLKREIRSLNQTIDSNENEKRALTETVQYRDSSIKELGRLLNQYETALREQQDNTSEKVVEKKEDEQMMSMIESLKEQLKMEKDRNDVIEKEKKELNTKLEGERVAFEEERKEYEKKVAELEKRVDHVFDSPEKQDLQEQASILAFEKDELQQRADRLASEKEQLKQQTTVLESENQVLKKSIDGVYEDTVNDVEEDKKLIDSLTSILQSLSNNVRLKNSRLQSLKSTENS